MAKIPLSDKQYIYAVYLLKRIGISKDKIGNYLSFLEDIYEIPSYSEYYEFLLANSSCIEVLKREVDLKKNIDDIKLKETKNSITATDLSNYYFCSASYSINKSFIIEFPTNEEKTITGTRLHEKLRLINKEIPANFKEEDVVENEVLDNTIIKKIKKCKLIFSGHTDEKKYFHNSDKNYYGQPDYIFKDPNNDFFVVEEKYHYLNTNKSNDIKLNFHSNHLIQLQSYIKYIKDYDLKYGILIYWFYDYNHDYDFPRIHYVSCRVIRKDDNFELLDNTFDALLKFLNDKEVGFENNINPKKCVNCVVNKYCAHKTDNYDKVMLPYDRKILSLKFVDFPKELKKIKPETQNMVIGFWKTGITKEKLSVAFDLSVKEITKIIEDYQGQ